MIAKRLGLTGALGTVAETVDGVYTGRLVGEILHGEAKAEAVRALAEREGLDLGRLRGVLRLGQRHPAALPRRPARARSTRTASCGRTPASTAGGSATTAPGARRPRSACPPRPGWRRRRRGRAALSARRSAPDPRGRSAGLRDGAVADAARLRSSPAELTLPGDTRPGRRTVGHRPRARRSSHRRSGTPSSTPLTLPRGGGPRAAPAGARAPVALAGCGPWSRPSGRHRLLDRVAGGRPPGPRRRPVGGSGLASDDPSATGSPGSSRSPSRATGRRSARSTTPTSTRSTATSTTASGSHALAEDLTSETFLRALRRIDSFTWQGKDIGAWFTTIARNLVPTT